MRWLPLLLCVAGCAPYSRSTFERHIAFLASDEMKGRDNDTDEGRKGAQYIADQFASIGLKPGGVFEPPGSTAAPGDLARTWFHDFETRYTPRSEKIIRGRNVAGVLPGRDLAHEYIVIAAHHDARGVIDGRVQNGADDNATGVAMVIELARAFAKMPCRRSLLFVSFDAEEDGMIGSREFVKAKVHEPAACAAMFVFDCFGGNFVPWETRTIYALGSEYSRALWDRVAKLSAGERDLEVRRLGVYIIEAFSARSDYGAYRAAHVPFVFLTSATPWYYHTEHDDLERVNYAKMALSGPFSERLIRETADDAGRPAFIPKPAPDYADDARALKEGAQKAMTEFALDDKQKNTLRLAVEQLDAVIADPGESPAVRIQRAMTAFFGIVMSQRPK